MTAEVLLETTEGIDLRALDRAVARFLSEPSLDAVTAANPGLSEYVRRHAAEIARRAFIEGDADALGIAHRSLFHIYEQHVLMPDRAAVRHQFHPLVVTIQHELESRWQEFETARCRLPEKEIPSDPDEYSRYFQEAFQRHPATHHPVYDYLRDEASRDQIIQYFTWDAPLNLRFYDVLVMSMIGTAGAARQELIENLLDETGRGNDSDAHTSLFRETLDYAGCDPSSIDPISALPWQGLAGYNISLNLALHRKYHFRLIGNMAVTEQIDPPNYEKLLRGCDRVGFTDARKLSYYSMHVVQEIAHGEGWMRHVMLPALARDPEAGREMLVGALLRLNTMTDYYDALLASFPAK